MLLAVSENMIPGAGYGEKLRFLRDHGYDGIELFPDIAAQQTDALKQAMAETGITAPSMRGRTRELLSADPAARQAQIEALKGVCALAEEFGVGAIIIVPVFGGPDVPDLTPWRSAKALEEAMLDSILPTIGDIAADHGVTLVMEPLNRYETHFLKTLAHGAAICQRVGHPNVRVMADFFHMHIEEADLAASLAANLDYVNHVHLAGQQSRSARLRAYGLCPRLPRAEAERVRWRVRLRVPPQGNGGIRLQRVFRPPAAVVARGLI